MEIRVTVHHTYDLANFTTWKNINTNFTFAATKQFLYWYKYLCKTMIILDKGNNFLQYYVFDVSSD